MRRGVASCAPAGIATRFELAHPIAAPELTCDGMLTILFDSAACCWFPRRRSPCSSSHLSTFGRWWNTDLQTQLHPPADSHRPPSLPAQRQQIVLREAAPAV